MSWVSCEGRIYFWRARFAGEANFFQLICGPGDQSTRGSYLHPWELNCSWAKTKMLNRAYADFINCIDDQGAFNEAFGLLLKGLIATKHLT